MSFELQVDEDLPSGIRRIAKSEIEKVRESVGGSSEDSRDVRVHEARKSLKKLRALVRLVRPAVSGKAYRRENLAFRDAAKPLTEVRDAQVLIDTLDKVVRARSRGSGRRSFTGVRGELVRHRREVSDKVLDEEEAFTRVDSAMHDALERLDDWADVHDGWSSVGEGVQRVYRRGQLALAAASHQPTVEHFHEWRKQVKYLRHQLELLQPMKPAVLRPLTEKAERLGDLLGDDHDLAMLRRELAGDPERFGGAHVIESLLERIDRGRQSLERQAVRLGRQIFHGTPGDFTRRLRGYWKAWGA